MSEDKRTYKAEENLDKFHNNQYQNEVPKYVKEKQKKDDFKQFKVMMGLLLAIGVLFILNITIGKIASKQFLTGLETTEENITKGIIDSYEKEDFRSYKVVDKHFSQDRSYLNSRTRWYFTVRGEDIEINLEVPEAVYRKYDKEGTIGFYIDKIDSGHVLYNDDTLLSVIGYGEYVEKEGK